MNDMIPGLRSVPAIVMAAGVVPMLDTNAPQHVRYGGVCLGAIAMILLDLQNGKKYGYTDKIMAAMRKIPGMAEADEGTVLGALCLAACGFLGGKPALDIAQGAELWPNALPVGYNALPYPAAAMADLKAPRRWLERKLGSQKAVDLYRQIMLITGAAGITTYGSVLGVPEIQFTGAMFMLSNGLSIASIALPPALEKLHEGKPDDAAAASMLQQARSEQADGHGIAPNDIAVAVSPIVEANKGLGGGGYQAK